MAMKRSKHDKATERRKARRRRGVERGIEQGKEQQRLDAHERHKRTGVEQPLYFPPPAGGSGSED